MARLLDSGRTGIVAGDTGSSRATLGMLSNRLYFGLAFVVAVAGQLVISGRSVIAFGNHVGASYLALDTPDLVFDRDGLMMSAK